MSVRFNHTSLIFDVHLFVVKVIVEKDGEISLLCKGGDTKVKERLANSEDEIMKITDEHLNVDIFFMEKNKRSKEFCFDRHLPMIV